MDSMARCWAPRSHHVCVGLTRRQSQRHGVSRLLLAQESRHSTPWLIFNVRPNRERGVAMRNSGVARLGMRSPCGESLSVAPAAAAAVERRETTRCRRAHGCVSRRPSAVVERSFRVSVFRSVFSDGPAGTLPNSEIPSRLRWPNQAPEPTPVLVTHRAVARCAPSTGVAHL